jgi:hypothetical protein
MGAGKGKTRRARSNWQATLPKSFPVDQITNEVFAKPAMSRQIVSLSSAISSRVISTSLHEAREQAQPGYGFVDGHTVIAHNRGSACDCENSRSRREQANEVGREFVCAHHMGTIGAHLLEKTARYSDDQRGLALLAKLATEKDEETREEITAELIGAVEKTIEDKPKALGYIISSVRNAGGLRPGASASLSGLLASARLSSATSQPSTQDYVSLIEEQEERKGEVIPINPETKIRRNIKAAMYHSSPEYRGFSPIITPAVLRPQQIHFYKKPSGEGLLIVRFEDKNETAYADLDQTGILTVSGVGECEKDSVSYAAFLYPLLDDANTQLHDGKKLSEDLQALNHFPAEYYDSQNSQTMQGKSDTRVRAIGGLTGAVYRAAVRADLTKQIKQLRRVHGDHSGLLERWRSDFKPPADVVPGLVAERVAF